MNILDDFLKEVKAFGVMKLSRKTGISCMTMYNWLHGRFLPSLEAIVKCLDAMGLELLIFDKEQ